VTKSWLYCHAIRHREWGTITANYAQNTSDSPRVANITVTARRGNGPWWLRYAGSFSPDRVSCTPWPNDIQTRIIFLNLICCCWTMIILFILNWQQYRPGLVVNPSIYGGGTITVSIVPGSSTLNSSQQPTNVSFTQSTNCIKLAARRLLVQERDDTSRPTRPFRPAYAG